MQTPWDARKGSWVSVPLASERCYYQSETDKVRRRMEGQVYGEVKKRGPRREEEGTGATVAS
ncbi:hypothetical protein Z043_124978 [Scleropages formosus]|uniref:Uncharacterized protein n=1 Tax=Scleropages formosus TaxID=113540 RepID=A0A0P7TIP9_SCLFO|nr:hypothetical protein Z043_124978 [Scleropages formosus]